MTTSPTSSPTGADLALAAAGAAAAVLPSVDPLVAAGAQPGNEHVTAAFSGAAIAELDGGLTGRIAGNAQMTNFAVLQALPRIAESSPSQGYLLEALMAAVAGGSDEAKVRMSAFLEGRAGKVGRQGQGG